MWVVVQSEASILLAACKAAVPALQVHEVERGVILPAFSVQSLSFIISEALPVFETFSTIILL